MDEDTITKLMLVLLPIITLGFGYFLGYSYRPLKKIDEQNVE